MRYRTLWIVSMAASMVAGIGSAFAQTALPTSFTYQGELRESGEPVTGQADMTFRLFDAETDGTQVGDAVGLAFIAVIEGRFAVQLDFGVEVFNGDARWLEIEVEYPSGEGNWTTLAPRQFLTATPYALQTRGMFCDDDGEIGIGTTNPSSPLQVKTTSGSAVSASASANSGYAAAFDAYVSSGDAYGLYAFNEADGGNGYAIYGETASLAGTAVYGFAFNSQEYSTGIGVFGKSAGDYNAAGVYGEATSVDGIAFGVRGKSHYMGVRGDHLATGNFGALGRSSTGVYGRGFGSNWAVHGVSEQGDAVRAEHQASGNYGLLGTSAAGVYGEHAEHHSYGQLGTEAEGVLGYCVYEPGVGTGVRGVGGTVGVTGEATATFSYLFKGVAGYVEGDYGESLKYGVFGSAVGGGVNHGVYGRAIGGSVNIGVYGIATGDTDTYAGYFDGDVYVSGNLTKGGGSFKIDHPLDPENKCLSHSFVESSEMMNVYSGTAYLDEAGEAWIEMPEWFEALNKDFRYQLTPIGAPAPYLHIARKITDNMFMIAGGEPGMEVSWQVTGVRQDPYAQAHPIQVESDKRKEERGLYLHPEAYDLPCERGIDYRYEKGLERKAQDQSCAQR